MKPRSIAAVAAGALLVGTVLLIIPVKAMATGTPAEDPEAAALSSALAGGDFLAGYDTGLYRVRKDGSGTDPLWTGGEVRKIVRAASGWFFLTAKGVLFSADLATFEDRSAGLPVKTYKLVKSGSKDFLRETQDLKDLELDPANPARLLTCTKDEVFLSENGGKDWRSLGQPVPTTGLKAVAFGPLPGSTETAAWASHPIKGLFVRKLGASSASGAWTAVTAGLAAIPGTTSMEEVSDLAMALPASASGTVPAASGTAAAGTVPSGTAAAGTVPSGTATAGTVPSGAAPAGFWAANSFLPRIYRWQPEARTFKQAWSGGQSEGTAESLDCLPDGSLRFVTYGSVKRLDAATGLAANDGYASRALSLALGAAPELQLLALSFPERIGGAATRQSSLSELWLYSFRDRKPYRAAAENHNGLYLATGFMVHPDTRAKYFSLMKDRRLDSVVVDMKDDFGRLRFEPRDPLLRKMGKTSSPMDIESFVAEAKAKGVWLVARVVVFKDQVVYDYAGNRYAVWDAKANAPWQGYNVVKAPAPAAAAAAPPSGAPNPYGPASPSAAAPAPAPAPTWVREPIKEYWVDPYSEDVWAYNVAIANEIIARGFDEVQFDYIRFPTDGANIDDAGFRWRDSGMDKESALASFLRYARENIKAPISIDIYGANGWFRSGVRTGQDVELLAKYVDVICPMYYPSHFEQGFLAQPPAEDRPYRIYRTGTFRTSVISRGRIVVRPYVQAFYMNVSYDRVWYNLDYVKREVAGVRDSLNLGMTFWNNSGRYDDIPVLEFGPDGRLSGPGLPATAAKPQAAASTAQAAGSTQASAQPAGAAPAAPTPEGILD